MRWRFWRRIKILPGVRLNLGKKGASLSLGPRGGKITVGAKGVRTTVGLPGTGLFATDYRRWMRSSPSAHTLGETDEPPDRRVPNWQFYFLQKLFNDRIGRWEHEWSQGTVQEMDVPTYCRWATDHIDRFGLITQRLTQLLEADLIEAMTPPGDAAKIAATIDGTSELVQTLIQWEQEVRIFAEHPVFGNIARVMVGMSWLYVEALKTFKRELDEQIATIAQTKRVFIHLKLQPMPHIDALEIEGKDFVLKAFSEGRVRGDFFQMRFRISRGETPLGDFSRQSLLENCKAGLFKPSDTYLSESHGAWRRLDELETEDSIEFGDLKQ